MIASQLTNGFGNNLFQCIAGKLLATHLNREHFFISPYPDYYGDQFLRELGFRKKALKDVANKVFVNEGNYNLAFSSSKELIQSNVVMNGYFENKDYYIHNRKIINSWFPNVEKRSDNDLVFHFRTGDRLFYKNEFDSKPSAERIKKAIDAFQFANLHIVTDLPEWKRYTFEEFKVLEFHVSVTGEKRVDNMLAYEYFTSCFDMLNSYNPNIKKRSVLEDFNFIRTFDNILFQHGTMAWWASLLSDASNISVYGPWRPWKQNNKNLSEVPGWVKWE
tara:strand:- start:6937 stop:7764 length:828 start_codon:yes stop_codon:yes gene_type:complete